MYIEVFEIVVNYQGKAAIMGTSTNVTEHMKTEKECIRLHEELSQIKHLASIGTLAGECAHEIKNPLIIVLNYISLFKDMLTKDGESKYLEMLTGLEKAALRIKEIIEDILALSRGDVRALEEIELKDIIQNSLNILNHEITRSSVILDIDVPPNLPPLICQKGLIEEVVVNLVDNALYALNRRYPKSDNDKVLHIGAYQDGDYIVLEVEDHGIGMAENIQKQVFNPFFSTKPSGKGTGLGLSLSLDIIKLHGGEFIIKSTEGKGTTVIIKLPLKEHKN
ncbi:MAG: sensor histidine kinase [Methermicoccaceae archaeon]